MKKVIRITESDLIRMISKIINETDESSLPETPETPPQDYEQKVNMLLKKKLIKQKQPMKQSKPLQ
jgi:hypothetical protein